MKRKRVPISPGAWWIEREPGTISIRAPGREVCYVPNVTDTDRANADAIALVPKMVELLRAIKDRCHGAAATDQVTGETWDEQIAELLAPVMEPPS